MRQPRKPRGALTKFTVEVVRDDVVVSTETVTCLSKYYAKKVARRRVLSSHPSFHVGDIEPHIIEEERVEPCRCDAST